MADRERHLRVNTERCIGCRACATTCPAGLIALRDTQRRRSLSFAAACAEDCDLCFKACPTEAIRLEPVTGIVPDKGTELGFDLHSCTGCGAPVATVEMLVWLRAAIPAQTQTDAEGQAWLELCPSCRQQVEAERVAREGIMTRWPG
jgi:ferredoxin